MKKPRRKSPKRAAARGKTRGSTTSQLRDDIDSGRTGDKVDWSDPAAAPLGTDAEAAGTPPNRREAGVARVRETTRPGDSVSTRWRPGASWVLVGVVIVLVAAIVGWIVAAGWT